eukprot:2632522-Rhodomonas_salina.1
MTCNILVCVTTHCEANHESRSSRLWGLAFDFGVFCDDFELSCPWRYRTSLGVLIAGAIDRLGQCQTWISYASPGHGAASVSQCDPWPKSKARRRNLHSFCDREVAACVGCWGLAFDFVG